MNRILASLLLTFATVLGHAQGTMNIYQTNGSILQVALSSIDSVTYQLAPPPPLMRIHQTGGSILSLAIAQIDSITYSTGGAPGTAQVATLPATAVGSTTAVVAGTITADGGSSVTARGICYGTNPLPSLGGPSVSAGAGLGGFQVQLLGLLPNTQYYARAYATNGQGTAYGNVVAFSTGFDPGGGVLATVVTAEPFGVTSHSASTGGQVSSDGGNTVVARGVVWGTGPNPTLANSFTVNGAGMGSFGSSLTNLQASTSYFVRAYATNGNGTSYGGSYQITTGPPSLAGVSTDGVNGVTVSAATATGTVSHQGGVTVTERGFCWSTSPDPTLQSNQGFVTAGSGLGGFVGNLSGLTGNTTYYVRAYATNSAGTAYGSQLQFTTSPVPPTVSTASASSILAFSANSGGNVSSTGGAAVTQRGVCWSTSPNPTTNANTTSDGSGTGSFSSSLLGLQPSTTYYVRAYATNSAGTAYGNQVQFTTPNGIPVLSTTAVSAVQATTASSGGSISSDGGAAIFTRGVCWSTSPNPTTANNVTSNGSGTGNFTSNLTGLQPSTTYYVRAYATNAVTTVYGNEVQFTTPSGIPVLSTTAVSSITTNGATSGGNITTDGGSPITARGVCWSTSPNPTTANSVTSNGSGVGSFTSNLSGLQSNTTYYARAYATNPITTVYGNEVQFTTLQPVVTLDEIWTNAQLTTTPDVQYGVNIDFLTSNFSSPNVTQEIVQLQTAVTLGQAIPSGFFNPADPSTAVKVTTLRMDIYQPNPSIDPSAARPLVIYVPGGNALPPPINGRPTGTRKDSSAVEICKRFARRGFVAASISYRLGWNPLAPTEQERRGQWINAVYRATHDLRQAVRHLKSQASAYEIDTTRIVVVGEEFGGYVALTHATLDDVSKIYVERFRPDPGNPNVSYIDPSQVGDPNGFYGQLTLYRPNGHGHATHFSVNLGGALPALSWLEAGHVPMVSFQTVFDPYIPFSQGNAIVPTTGTAITPVEGSNLVQQSANAFGNNAIFAGIPSNDVYTNRARSLYGDTYSRPSGSQTISNGAEGLFPLLTPQWPSPLTEEGGPWQWWDPNSALAQTVVLTGPPPITANQAALTSNPDMSHWKGRAYIDTIMGYVGPRLVYALGLASVPALITTSTPTNITSTTAVAGGVVTNTGGSAVSARGVCWRTSPAPLITDNATVESGSNGSFTSQISGLQPNTIYYVRAYITNAAGTYYGNELQFSTLP